MFGFLNRILPTQYEKRITALVAMIVLLVGVSLTARLLDQEQDIRQRASETSNLEQELISPPAEQVISVTPPPQTAPTSDPLATALSVSVNLNGASVPQQASRAFTLSVYDANNIFVISETTPLIYQNGMYSGTANIGNLQTGTYTFKIKTSGFLENALVTLPQAVTKGQQLVLPRVTLLPGDINSDGVINSIDYSLLTECFESSTTSSTCDPAKKEASDLNIDGLVNQLDLNILLPNMGK